MNNTRSLIVFAFLSLSLCSCESIETEVKQGKFIKSEFTTDFWKGHCDKVYIRTEEKIITFCHPTMLSDISLKKDDPIFYQICRDKIVAVDTVNFSPRMDLVEKFEEDERKSNLGLTCCFFVISLIIVCFRMLCF